MAVLWRNTVETKGLKPPGNGRRRAVFGCILVLAGLLCLLLPGGAGAQSGGLAGSLILRDDTPDIDLGRFLYVTRDANKSLSYKDIYDRFNQGWRGDAISGNVLTLGSSSVPHWIIFSVYNQSWTDKWVLGFGQHMTGRIGLIKKVFLFDQISRTKYLDNVSPTDNPYVGGEGSGGTTVSLNLPRGQQSLFFMYVVPEPGVAATLVPRLMTEQAFAKKVADPLQPSRLMNLFFVAIAGFIAAVIVMQRYPAGGLFLLYYLVQAGLYNYQNATLYSDFPLANDIVGALTTLSAVASLFLARSFLDIGRTDHVQNRTIFAVAAGNVAAAIAASVISRDSGLYPFIMFAPFIATQLFLSLLSLAQAYSGRPGAIPFALAWLCLLAGSCATFLDAMNMLPPMAPLIAGYWYSLLPQGFLFIAAMVRRSLAVEYDSRQKALEQGEEDTTVERLKQSKEASENQRLRRLIEHERQVMTELRERESKQNDEMRKAMASADEANRAKSAFLAVISHEIRTPMSGILGMVRLLLETALNTNQRDYAQTIQDSGDAMLALLNDILDFEKIESGKMDLEHIDFDMHRLIQGITTLMSGHAAAKKIALKVDIGENLPRFAIGDPVRLRQVLLNLTGNSIKFTSQGSVTLHVQLEKAEEQAMAAQGMHRIRFAVEDTGVGISPEAQKNLFNPFAQADSSVARKFGGTGLGLAISQRLIEAMGGRIRIDSTEGRGSTFHFSLAMEEGSADALKERQAGAQVGAQKSEKALDILIVDDNEINQKLLREFVDRMGHRTSLAGSGEQALEVMKGKPFDMILMDVELPGISGMGATKAIRALPDRKAAATPVIALTGNVRDEDIRQCFAANMNGHLPKPVDPKRLKIMIDKVIKGALDNPVILAEQGETGFGHINRVNAPPPPAKSPAGARAAAENKAAQPAAAAAAKAPPTAPAAAEPSAIAFAKYDEQSLSGTGDSVAPIRELAFSMADLRPTEEELNSDSFAEAINHAEEKEKKASSPQLNGTGNVFDQTVLADLRGSIDRKSFDDMIKGLIDKADEIVAALDQAAAAGDRMVMTARAHEMKGMAANFGLKELSDIAAQAEKILKENRSEGLSELLTALPAANQRAKDALQAWMKN